MFVPQRPLGDIVVLDNLGSHKVAGVAEVRSRPQEPNCVTCPTLQPWLYPTKQVFAKLRTLPRKAAKRTVDTPLAAIGELLDQFPATNASTTSAMPAMASKR